MSGKSDIEWTEATWNPVRGYVKVSPGCKHCYAEAFAERFRGVAGHPYEQGFDLRLVPEKLRLPMTWREPRRVFVNSMSDFFQRGRARSSGVPWAYVAACFGVMALCGHHTFQVLTKGAEEMSRFMDGLTLDGALEASAIPEVWMPPGFSANVARAMRAMGRDPDAMPWPLPNVHLGVSVEDRKYGLPRIDHLRRVPAAVRFLSVEPLLEDLGTVDLTGIHWVIVGAESGHGARSMHEDWVRSLRDQCAAAGVPFFYKQKVEGRKKVSLPMLDGRQWMEMPR